MVAQPAERAHHPREGAPTRTNGIARPSEYTREEHRALERRARRAGQHEDRGEHRADARRGADRERAAEEDARAARARALDEPGPHEPLRPREEPHEREAEHDEHEARDLLEQELVAEAGCRRAATLRRRAATKNAVNPRTNGMLATTTRRACPGRPSSSALDGGDRREVARDERQDARREEREEPREERDRDLARAHASNRVELRVERGARARGRAAAAGASSAAPAAPAPCDRADAERPGGEHAERHEPGEQVEARLRRLGDHAGAELGDELVLDLLSVAPSARRSG